MRMQRRDLPSERCEPYILHIAQAPFHWLVVRLDALSVLAQALCWVSSLFLTAKAVLCGCVMTAA